MGSLPKFMYGPNLWRGEVVSSPALKDHSSGYMGGGAREGRAGQVERILPKGTSPFAEKRKKKNSISRFLAYRHFPCPISTNFHSPICYSEIYGKCMLK